MAGIGARKLSWKGTGADRRGAAAMQGLVIKDRRGLDVTLWARISGTAAGRLPRVGVAAPVSCPEKGMDSVRRRFEMPARARRVGPETASVRQMCR